MIKYFNQLSLTVKSLFWISIGLLLYGYLCRIASIYFFWESKTIGWFLFFILVVVWMREVIVLKRKANRNSVLEKIVVGFSVFILLVKMIMWIVIPTTSVFNKAVAFIRHNKELYSEVGQIRSVVLLQQGSISMSSSDKGETGQADLYFIVKGSEKYLDINIVMEKENAGEWQIQIVK